MSIIGDNLEIINSLKNKARRAYKNKFFDEAYSCFTKIIEYDCNDWESIAYRGLSAGWESTQINHNLNQNLIKALNDIKTSKELIENMEIEESKKNEYINKIIIDFYTLCKSYLFLVWKNKNDSFDKYPSDSGYKYLNSIRFCIDCLEILLQLIENVDSDKDIKTTKIDIVKKMISQYEILCSVDSYWSNDKENNLCYFGLSLEEKEIYISKYFKWILYLEEEGFDNIIDCRISLLDPKSYEKNYQNANQLNKVLFEKRLTEERKKRIEEKQKQHFENNLDESKEYKENLIKQIKEKEELLENFPILLFSKKIKQKKILMKELEELKNKLNSITKID